MANWLLKFGVLFQKLSCRICHLLLSVMIVLEQECFFCKQITYAMTHSFPNVSASRTTPLWWRSRNQFISRSLNKNLDLSPKALMTIAPSSNLLVLKRIPISVNKLYNICLAVRLLCAFDPDKLFYIDSCL